MLPADPAMLLTFVVIVVTVVLYAMERLALEVVALGSVVAFLLIFTFFSRLTRRSRSVHPSCSRASPILRSLLSSAC